mmetsp:Transcript_68919/g.213193  ORF Transcript_68919/g.213193 Transcript_68919/m.213193 type:complete len:280 (+) Transcript_68919:615-1454(+)
MLQCGWLCLQRRRLLARGLGGLLSRRGGAAALRGHGPEQRLYEVAGRLLLRQALRAQGRRRLRWGPRRRLRRRLRHRGRGRGHGCGLRRRSRRRCGHRRRHGATGWTRGQHRGLHRRRRHRGRSLGLLRMRLRRRISRASSERLHRRRSQDRPGGRWTGDGFRSGRSLGRDRAHGVNKSLGGLRQCLPAVCPGVPHLNHVGELRRVPRRHVSQLRRRRRHPRWDRCGVCRATPLLSGSLRRRCTSGAAELLASPAQIAEALHGSPVKFPLSAAGPPPGP